MFRHLRTKLTVLYAGLFAAVLLLISVAVFTAISDNAQRAVRRELATSGIVFDRLWALRAEQLESGAAMQAQDFGFRQALASHDAATIRSALNNLKLRLGIDEAFMIGADGRPTASDSPLIRDMGPDVLFGLQGDDNVSGVTMLGGAPYELVSIPVRAPVVIGWVVFASKLDGAQMQSLQKLSAIPLDASILYQQAGRWRDPAASSTAEANRISHFVDARLGKTARAPDTLSTRDGPAVALVKPLPLIGAGAPVVLLLQYPIGRAIAPYMGLMGVLAAAAALGLLALFMGTWALARSVTRPISALEDAVKGLQHGEQTHVAVETQDEIGRLASSFNGMAAEIVERETELQSTQAFLDGVIENLPAMVVVKDLESRFVLVNRAGEDLLGISSADAVGRTDHDLFPKEQADFFLERDRAVLASGELLLIPEEPIQTRSNGVRYLQTKKIVLSGPDGQPQFLLAISEDITERKAAAEALERARDEAEAANRAKSSFLANMSHEVRTPLNGVLGVAGILARTALEPKQREMVEIIENSASVLQRVLNDVLDLARVEAGRFQVVEEAFSLADAVTSMARSSGVQCKGKGLDFQLATDPRVDRIVMGDRVRLEQVLGNLLSNAVKFTEKGAIGLSVTVEDGVPARYTFEVRDTGIGFDPAMRETLFQPFIQADNSITRRFGGTGLGLSISRELAQAMGGELSANSVPGEGAVFTLVLPLPEAAAASDAPRAVGSAEPVELSYGEDAPLRVLLADDHETNRRVVRLILNSVGVDLVSTENGAEAVATFKARPFDVVLMDLQMPVMDGLTAIGLIRAHEAGRGQGERTPIIVLSANAMPEHVAAAREAGADAHAAKPITAPALIAAVQAALAGPLHDAGEDDDERLAG